MSNVFWVQRDNSRNNIHACPQEQIGRKRLCGFRLSIIYFRFIQPPWREFAVRRSNCLDRAHTSAWQAWFWQSLEIWSAANKAISFCQYSLNILRVLSWRSCQSVYHRRQSYTFHSSSMWDVSSVYLVISTYVCILLSSLYVFFLTGCLIQM